MRKSIVLQVFGHNISLFLQYLGKNDDGTRWNGITEVITAHPGGKINVYQTLWQFIQELSI